MKVALALEGLKIFAFTLPSRLKKWDIIDNMPITALLDVVIVQYYTGIGC